MNLANDNEITIGSSEVFRTLNGVDQEILTKKCSVYNTNTCNYFTKWGIRFEPISKEVYELYTGHKVLSCKMKSHKHYKWLKAIPDGIINFHNGVHDEQRLIEFKNPVTRNIHKGTPDKYKSQMQIAMEVFNVDTCDYFDCKFYEYDTLENYQRDLRKDTTVKFKDIKTTEELQVHLDNGMSVIGTSTVIIDNEKVAVYWKLNDFVLQKIQRNKKWFENHITNIVDSRNRMLFAKRIGLPNYKEYIENDKEMKCSRISDTFNYMLKDPLIDWLNMYGRSQGFKKDNEYPIYDETMDFNAFIIKKSKEFKENVTDYLINEDKYDTIDISDNLKDETGNINYSDINYVSQMYQTFNEMLKGRDIIFNPVLIDFDTKYYCIPSCIVKQNVLNKMVNTPETMETRSHRKDDRNNDRTNDNETHYVPLFFKFQTIKLCSDSVHVLNTGTIPPTKCKITFCCNVLEKIQRQPIKKGYILGRKYDYTKAGTTFYSNNCFDKIGTVDLSGKDADYLDHLEKGIKWLIYLKEDGHKWVIQDSKNSNLPSHLNLYPNMKNDYNSNWGNAKGIISAQISEITSLWYSGIKNRNTAFENDIYSLKHPKCNTETLGLSKRKNAGTIERIIDINHRNMNKSIYSSGPIHNNIDNWQKKSSLELFIDFEDINSINDNFNTFPEAAKLYGNLTFMVGLGYIDKNNKWIYKCFLAKKDTKKEEKRIMIKFLRYIIKLCNEFDAQEPKLFHYSGSEASKLNYYINKMVDKYVDGSDTESNIRDENSLKYNISNVTFNWCDLHKIILNEPFVIKGAYNFTLKEISKALYSYGHIETLWKNVGSCTNGISAMTVAFYCYNNNKDVTQNVKMKEVIKYNECDVKVMYEILEYFRSQLSVSPKSSPIKGKKRKRNMLDINDIETDNNINMSNNVIIDIDDRNNRNVSTNVLKDTPEVRRSKRLRR